MLFMRVPRRYGWRWAAAAVLIALLVLGLGFVLRSAGLGAAANVAQLVALAPLIGGLVAWARARREVQHQTPEQSMTFGEFLRIIADAQGLTGRDLHLQMPAWDDEAIDAYMDGSQLPTWEFVTDFLDIVAKDDPWRRELLQRKVSPLWQATARHQSAGPSLTIVTTTGATELSPSGKWFTALQQVSQTRQVLSLVQHSIDRHTALTAGLAEMADRLSQAVISLMNERDRLRIDLEALQTRAADGGASPNTFRELDDLRRQLHDTQERLQAAERIREATRQRLQESERQRLLAERLRDEALKQAEEARRRLAELEGRPAALPSVAMGRDVAEDTEPALMGHDDQRVAEEVLHRVDEVLRDEAEKLDELEDELTDRPKPSSVPSHEKPVADNQSLLRQIPSGINFAAQATTGTGSDGEDLHAKPPATTVNELAVEVLRHFYEGNRERWSVGSGFLIRDGYVLTAAQNVGPGELLVRTGEVERPAVIRLSGGEDVAIALLELTEGAGNLRGFQNLRFGTVDRSTADFVERCWAIGFPRFKERDTVRGKPPRQGRPYRLSTQVGGRIPTGENFGLHQLTLQVGHAPRPLTSNAEDQSAWAGMSGAVVFADEVVLGVVSEHHLPEGDSSLTVVAITAIVDLPDAGEWWRLLEVHPADFVRLPVPREARRHGMLHVWPATDRPESRRLVSAFEIWLIPDSINRGEPLRVFWLVGEPGPDRSEGLLACLSRAVGQGRPVYEVDEDLVAGANALSQEILDAGLALPPVISVDLRTGEHTRAWQTISNALLHAANRFMSSSGGHLRGVDPYPRLVIAGTAEQEMVAYEELKSVADIQPCKLNGAHIQRPHSFHGATRMASQSLTDEDVYNRGLPITTERPVGREDELALLDEAWTLTSTQVAFIIALGGAGKSALVNTWLSQMRELDYRGAWRVFAWSFRSQGATENLVSADPFVSAALTWLGGDAPISVNPSERGHYLAALIRRQKLLLVLDGIEPLQYPLSAPHVGGQFTDESVRALLADLAEPGWKGLCLITTRVPLTDLERFQGTGTVVQLDLKNLTAEDGAILLQELIVRRTPRRELLEAVREVDGHALAVTLLGNYIRDVHNGNLAGRFDLDELTVSAREGGHARRIVASYTNWLELHDQAAELAILRLIGLFDRPAEPEAMAALLADGAMAPYTGNLQVIGDKNWSAAVDALRKMGLLNKPILQWPGTVDAHLLVREHFREQLRQNHVDMWLQGNRILYEFYQSQAPDLPETPAGISQLYAAVTHGCAAGLYQEVFDKVLLPRVWRGRRMNFSTRRLGMIGSDLAALSNFFRPRRWEELRTTALSPRARVLILTNAGVRLRQFGRLIDARDCFGAVAREIDTETADPTELEDASYAFTQNCELLVIAGKLINDLERPGDESRTAQFSAMRAIEYSRRGHEPYFTMHAHSSLGEVYFMLGDLSKAGQLFEQARAIDRERHPRPPFLYSQGLFRYAYYLIETGRAEQVLNDASVDESWGTNAGDSSLLSQAIRILILGAAHRAMIEAGRRDANFLAETERLLDQSIDAFKYAGYSDYTVRGLLERAHFYRIRGGPEYYRKALRDLDDATIETDRGQMEILYTDVLLQRAACYLSYWRTMTSPERAEISEKIKESLADAAQRVEDLNYGRRRDMLGSLQEAAREIGMLD
jgi:tetratricopeptide (TPR) repeat protein